MNTKAYWALSSRGPNISHLAAVAMLRILPQHKPRPPTPKQHLMKYYSFFLEKNVPPNSFML